jgi:hypothetical protein
MLQMLTETIASGRGSRPNDDIEPNDVIEKVTGAPPTSFTDFARRAVAAWARDQGS